MASPHFSALHRAGYACIDSLALASAYAPPVLSLYSHHPHRRPPPHLSPARPHFIHSLHSYTHRPSPSTCSGPRHPRLPSTAGASASRPAPKWCVCDLERGIKWRDGPIPCFTSSPLIFVNYLRIEHWHNSFPYTPSHFSSSSSLNHHHGIRHRPSTSSRRRTTAARTTAARWSPSSSARRWRRRPTASMRSRRSRRCVCLSLLTIDRKMCEGHCNPPQQFCAPHSGAHHHHTHHTCTQGAGDEKGELKACLNTTEVEAVAIGVSKALEGK